MDLQGCDSFPRVFRMWLHARIADEVAFPDIHGDGVERQRRPLLDMAIISSYNKIFQKGGG